MTASIVAAWVFVALSAVLVTVQIAVVAGAPLGPFVWGGRHEGRLPRSLRLGSAASILIYVLLVLIVLDRAGLIVLFPAGFSVVAAWVVFGFLAFGTLLNLISRSKRERMLMTPLAALLAASALIVALGL